MTSMEHFFVDIWRGSKADDRLQALSANPKGEVQFGGRSQANMTFGSNGVNMNVSSGAYDGFNSS